VLNIHKRTFSGRFLSFHSSHPLCHKIGMIYNLTDRAFLLSHPKFHQKNLELTVNLLLENGYPVKLIFEKINYRLKTLIHNKNNQSTNQSNTIETKNKSTLVLPYINRISELVASTVDKSQYITGYRVLNNLGKYIKVHKVMVIIYFQITTQFAKSPAKIAVHRMWAKQKGR